MILEQEVAAIRAVRQRISEECGHDPRRLRERYQRLARQLRADGQKRFVTAPDNHHTTGSGGEEAKDFCDQG